MNSFNYTPAHTLSNTLYELYVGFSSTHPKADEWVKGWRENLAKAMGAEYDILLDSLTNSRIAQEGDGDTVADFDKEFNALDSLTVHKRPLGWVPNGTTRPVMQAPNLPTLLVWLRHACDAHNTEKLDSGTILTMMLELKSALPSFGAVDAPWVMSWQTDENEPDPEFIDSNVSERCFRMDSNGEDQPYRVNGKYVLFACPLGWVKVWQGVCNSQSA